MFNLFRKRADHPDRPRFVTLSACKVVEEVLKPGDRIRFHEKHITLVVLAKNIEVVEWNPEVEKTRVFCRNVQGSGYEVWYVAQTPVEVQNRVAEAYR